MIALNQKNYEMITGSIYAEHEGIVGWSLCACSCTPYACPSVPCNACTCVCPPGSCSCGCSCTCPKCRNDSGNCEFKNSLDW